MTKPQLHNNVKRPAPAGVTLEGFPESRPHRAISWESGYELSGAGALSDTTKLYIAEDKEGHAWWWHEIDEGTVGTKSEAEQISFEEVLDTVEPRYWPVVCGWTLEAIVHYEGWYCSEERWRDLLKANPNAQQQLKEILVALMPNDTDEARLHRRLHPSAAKYHGQLLHDPDQETHET
jgi:hypothetical protein